VSNPANRDLPSPSRLAKIGTTLDMLSGGILPTRPHASRVGTTAWQQMQPWSAGGGYVNHLCDEGSNRVRQAYGEQSWYCLLLG
jgi:hypothetical protein